MRTTHLLAAGALTVGGIAAVPAAAPAGDPAAAGSTTTAGAPAYRPGGCGWDVRDRRAGPLAAAERADLRRLAVRAALAHDLATAFAARYAVGGPPAHAAAVRLDALRALLDRYAVDDPTRGAPGRRADPAAAADHDRLRARGRSGAAALGVLRDLDRRAVADLTAALARAGAPDLRHTYLHLLVAANHRLRAGLPWSGR